MAETCLWSIGTSDISFYLKPSFFQTNDDTDPAVEVVGQVAAGAEHTIVLTSTGRVFSCGSNDFGQVGFNVATRLKSSG